MSPSPSSAPSSAPSSTSGPTTTRAAQVAQPLAPVDLEHLRLAVPDVRVVDVRTPGEFAGRHIPGSYNVPLPQLAEHRAELHAASSPVVLVCESGKRAAKAELLLAEGGLDAVHVLDGGVAAWERDGRPLVRPAPGTKVRWNLERQVRLVAGGLVATAIGASIVWPPARFGAGAIGLGLVVAALTDTCAMGSALARLPYNRATAPTCDLPTVVGTIADREEAV